MYIVICEIKYMETIEKEIALRRDKIDKHISKWGILTTPNTNYCFKGGRGVGVGIKKKE